MPTINPTPEQLTAARDRALYLQMTQEGYGTVQPAEVREALRNQSVETRLGEMKAQIDAQKQVLDGLKGERDKALRWGVIALGTAVMGMGSWIVNLFTAGHIR